MRYGTLPVVRKVGGLKDSVPDIGEPGGKGCGIQFTHFELEDAYWAIYRGLEFCIEHLEDFKTVRQRNMELDFSWEKAAGQYITLYRQML